MSSACRSAAAFVSDDFVDEWNIRACNSTTLHLAALPGRDAADDSSPDTFMSSLITGARVIT